MAINIIGVPLDLGSERIGADMGPNALRYQKFVSKLQSTGLTIIDHGNIPCPSPEDVKQGKSTIKYLDPITEILKQLLERTKTLLNNSEEKLLILGGDHSIALGSIAGASTTGTIGVIWIDAHPDMNTDKTTPSGNIHGMPLAALMGFGHEKLTTIAKTSPAIQSQNVVLIGIKDIDQGEQELIDQEDIRAFYIRDILAEGLKPVFEAIKQLKDRVDHVWLSLDLDCVDADYAPGVGMPNKGGLTYREIHAIIEHIGKECDILGMDLVEYNPVKDIDHKTAQLATELTAKAFGKDYSWYADYLKEHSI